ncbi:APH(3') family aminoglycoside O-phosphotransferase [Actinorhabdospora filicis]|nr:APH(3') family aminoglycoside O-phosphotransferase [Actinorhabdospora filicis]
MTQPSRDAAVSRLRHRYPAHEWEPVTLGMSGAGVYRLSGPSRLHVKIGDGEVAAEGERLAWLAKAGVPAPEVIETGEVEGHAFVVTVTLPGRPASDPWPQGRRLAVAGVLGGFARELHAVAVEGCPFDRRLAVRVPRARADVAAGRADPEDGARLLAELHALLAAGPVEEPVVCHGDFCLPNVLLEADSLAVTGIIDVGRLGVADRYTDVAVMARSIVSDLNPQFGPAHAEAFLRAYGAHPPDALRIELYRLLDEFP